MTKLTKTQRRDRDDRIHANVIMMAMVALQEAIAEAKAAGLDVRIRIDPFSHRGFGSVDVRRTFKTGRQNQIVSEDIKHKDKP